MAAWRTFGFVSAGSLASSSTLFRNSAAAAGAASSCTSTPRARHHLLLLLFPTSILWGGRVFLYLELCVRGFVVNLDLGGRGGLLYLELNLWSEL